MWRASEHHQPEGTLITGSNFLMDGGVTAAY